MMQEPPVTAADPAEPKGLSWGLESRLQFIDFRLRWERRINRMDLTEHFGISVPQASLDIAKYTELAPSNLTYDRSSKTYTAASSFHPLYQRSSAQRYLAELLATKMGIMEPTASFIGSAPETDWAPSPWRTINEQTVEAVVRAIRQQEAIWVSYQSMTSLDESVRLLSPHALGNDGFRWHMRAFCHKRQRFSDFVLARILRIDGFEAEPSGLQPGCALAYCADAGPCAAPRFARGQDASLGVGLRHGRRTGQTSMPPSVSVLHAEAFGLAYQGSARPARAADHSEKPR